MKHLDIDRLKAAHVRTEPFEYTIVPNFLSGGSLQHVIETFPDGMKGGSYPLDSVEVPDALQDVIDEMDGPEFETVIAEKFGVEIAGRPKMFTLRGYCRSTDGKIHTDSKDKIITALLYLNENWDAEGGKLRLLRSGIDLEDYVEEVPPDNGTLLVFKRSDKSFHGHGVFEGVRRSVQMNWMTTEAKRAFHKIRHWISASRKKLPL